MQERGQAARYQDKWLMMRGVIALMSCETLLYARMSLLCFEVVGLETTLELRCQILASDVFLCFAGFL